VRILLLPGTYDFKNLGDVAMLQIAVERLGRCLPGCSVRVFTYTPDLLQRFCPGAEPAHLEARDRLRKAKLLPRRLWREGEARFRESQPRLFLRLWQIKATVLRGKYLFPLSFLRDVQRADALFMTGCGMINDCFPEAARQALDILQMGIDRGILTALFSQGIGPLEEARLRRHAAEVLPGINAIFLRETRASRPLLESCGVSSRQVAFTGDDAVELAWRARRDALGTHLGYNLRLSTYSGMSEEVLSAVCRVLALKAQQYGVSLVGVPITRGDIDCDLITARRMLEGMAVNGTPGTDVDTPLKAIERTAECRIVVTGAYHLAVFALSQGIPAICIARNLYYTDKFLGLAEAFGDGCTVLNADKAGFESFLAAAIDEMWERAPGLHGSLVKSAARQVDLANAAYTRLLCQLRPNGRAAKSMACSVATAS
jgi:polysaccharide pyruvyl transferase WcaK-like protein